jgi:hypothetical protein
MKVMGILVEGKDGKEYLLGIGPRATGRQRERPTLWLRAATGKFVSLEQTRDASRTIREQLGVKAPLQPGLTHDEHVKWAVLEAATGFLKTFFADARW